MTQSAKFLSLPGRRAFYVFPRLKTPAGDWWRALRLPLAHSSVVGVANKYSKHGDGTPINNNNNRVILVLGLMMNDAGVLLCSFVWWRHVVVSLGQTPPAGKNIGKYPHTFCVCVVLFLFYIQAPQNGIMLK